MRNKVTSLLSQKKLEEKNERKEDIRDFKSCSLSFFFLLVNLVAIRMT
jgi:hypothetical protein